MENNEGSITGAMAIAALERSEALHTATVALQELIRKDRAEANAALRQQAAELREILRKEAGALQLMRGEIASSVQALQALQPGIEGAAARGVRNALASGGEKLRDNLERQVSGSAGELQDAARQVKGMVRWLTPLWAGLIAAGGLLLGIALMYFFVAAAQRRIEEKIDRMRQAAPVAAQPTAAAPPPSAGAGRDRKKPHGTKAAATDLKPSQTDQTHEPADEEHP